MSRLHHRVNLIASPLTPHHIVVEYEDRIDFSIYRNSDLHPMFDWCESTWGINNRWQQRNRVFMFATRAMAAQFKLAFG